MEMVSGLRREVMSLRHENTQLQSERDRLRRMLGYPSSGLSGAYGLANGFDYAANGHTIVRSYALFFA
jgi:hypothetical protein